MVKKINKKYASEEKLYDILDNELKYRIRELYFQNKGDDNYYHLVDEIQEIVDVQDALDEELVLVIKVEEELDYPTAETPDGDISYILEINIHRDDYLEVKKIHCYDLENLDIDIDEYFVVLYK